MANVKGRTQARGDARRRQLLEAAGELFAQGGWRSTGIAAVAQRAGVTGATLLHHFGSKERLLEAVLAERDERELGPWQDIVGPGGLETLRRLPSVASSWRREPGIARLHAVLLSESLDPAAPMHDYFVRRQSGLRASLRRALDAGRSRGEIIDDIDTRAIAVQITSFMDGVVLQWALDPGRIPLERTFQDYSRTLVDALARPPLDPIQRDASLEPRSRGLNNRISGPRAGA